MIVKRGLGMVVVVVAALGAGACRGPRASATRRAGIGAAGTSSSRRSGRGRHAARFVQRRPATRRAEINAAGGIRTAASSRHARQGISGRGRLLQSLGADPDVVAMVYLRSYVSVPAAASTIFRIAHVSPRRPSQLTRRVSPGLPRQPRIRWSAARGGVRGRTRLSAWRSATFAPTAAICQRIRARRRRDHSYHRPPVVRRRRRGRPFAPAARGGRARRRAISSPENCRRARSSAGATPDCACVLTGDAMNSPS